MRGGGETLEGEGVKSLTKITRGGGATHICLPMNMRLPDIEL